MKFIFFYVICLLFNKNIDQMNYSFLRKKAILPSHTSTSNEAKFNRILGVKDLIFMGVGALIGAGIFSTIGKALYEGGPSVVWIFILSAITCGFTALCYAEFASRVPLSGSAYTYSYVVFGELIAWIMGWTLILEYSIGNIVLAISWSEYFDNILQAIGIHLPRWMITDYKSAQEAYDKALSMGESTLALAWEQAPMLFGKRVLINIPAFTIVAFITWLTYIGIKESKKGTNIMAYIKLAILLIVIILGVFYVKSENYTPFFPNGFSGMLKGISAIFFAYIGFDAISTTAEECKNPQRDLPRAMGYTLLICTFIYVGVTLVMAGMVNYKDFFNVNDPMAFVFNHIDLKFMEQIVSISAVVASMGALLVFQIGQPRIWLNMSRDGLLPKKFALIHPKYKTPSFSTIITGLLVGIPSLFLNNSIVVDLTSIGTLFAFFLVCMGILFLPKETSLNKGRKIFRLPYINGKWVVPILFIGFLFAFKERTFRALSFDFSSAQDIFYLIFLVITSIISFFTFIKNYSLIPILGACFCLYLMIEVPVDSWIAFILWMIVGLLIYFLYSYHHSLLNKKKE